MEGGAFGFINHFFHRSKIVDTRGVKKECRRQSDLSFNLPHNSSRVSGPSVVVSSVERTIESRLKRNLAFRSRWLRHGLIRLALSARRLRDGDGLCARVATRRCTCTRHSSSDHRIYNHARACVCVCARICQQEKPIGLRDAAKSQRDWYGIVRHNQR